MVEAAARGKFDILVIDAVSRLARNVGELFTCIETLKKHGVGVLILKGEYWTFNMDYNDILRLAIEAGLAQAESMQTSKRVKDHMETVCNNGQLLGGNMFGYRLKRAVERVDNTLVVVPSEAYTIRVIFERYTDDDLNERLSTSTLVKYLVENKLYTYEGDLNWTASKIRRILVNEKYMGYQMYGKSKVIDTVTKKKVLTKIEPIREDVFDENGNLVQKCNLTKGKWEPIVSEELWWKAYHIRTGRSAEKKGTRTKNGMRISSDVYARKLFCSCGYSLSPEYTHVATDDRPAQVRYKCRWQINNAVLLRSKLLNKKDIICEKPAVGELKMWLSAKYVFEHMFKNGKEAVLKTLSLIEQSKEKELVELETGDITYLLAEKAQYEKRLKNFILMKADGEISSNEYKELYEATSIKLSDITDKINSYEANKAKITHKMYNFDEIEQKLNALVDVSGVKVSDELVDMFIERIIYRGNDEYLWVFNLTGTASGNEQQYRITSYDAEYADSLMDDDNFDIVARFVIPLSECQKYCEKKAKRGFKPKFWKPMIIKIAVVGY